MNEEKQKVEHKKKKKMTSHNGGMSSMIYFLGLIGAATFYLQAASTFLEGALGILKAIVWPAMVVYQLLNFLQ